MCTHLSRPFLHIGGIWEKIRNLKKIKEIKELSRILYMWSLCGLLAKRGEDTCRYVKK